MLPPKHPFRFLSRTPILVRGTAEQELEPEKLFRPFIGTLLCGLPHPYRAVAAPAGRRVRVPIEIVAGGTWELLKTTGAWQLVPPAMAAPTAGTVLAPEVAWRLFAKSGRAAEAGPLVHIAGDAPLAQAALGLVAVMS